MSAQPVYFAPQPQFNAQQQGMYAYAYSHQKSENAGGAPVQVVYVPQPQPSVQYQHQQPQQYPQPQQQQPHVYQQQGQTANSYAVTTQQPPPPGYAPAPSSHNLSFSQTMDAIRSPHTYLNVASVNYLRCNEFRGYFYCSLLAAVITGLFAAQLMYQTNSNSSYSYTIGITYFYTSVIVDNDGEESSSTTWTKDNGCSAAKMRLIVGGTFACIGLVCCVASMLFAFADSPRRCIARCDIFQKNIPKLNYHAPTVLAMLWVSLLIPFSLMADYLNGKNMCGSASSLSKTGYVVGPGMGLTIAAWCLVTVVEGVRFYLVMSGWVPRVGEGVVAASQGLMMMPNVNMNVPMSPMPVVVNADGSPQTYQQSQQLVQVMYVPAGAAAPAGWVAAPNNQLPPQYYGVPLQLPAGYCHTEKVEPQPHMHVSPAVAQSAVATSDYGQQAAATTRTAAEASPVNESDAYVPPSKE